MKCGSVRGRPGKVVAREAIGDAVRDLAALGLLALGILLLARLWAPIGSFGRWLYLLAALGILLQFLAGCLLGLADSILAGATKEDVEGSGWLLLATVVRLFEVATVFALALFVFQQTTVGAP